MEDIISEDEQVQDEVGDEIPLVKKKSSIRRLRSV